MSTKNKKKSYKIHITIYSILFILLIFNITNFIINKEAVSSFKRLYNNYSKALQTTVNQMGGETGCYFSTQKEIAADFSGCSEFYKVFTANLRVTKYCKNNSLKNGCVPYYKKYATNPQCAGFSESMMTKFNQSFVIGDTNVITVFNQPADKPKPIMAVDSNGIMLPNKSGHDLFSLVIMRNPKGDYYFHSNVTYCLPAEKGGISKLQDVYK